MKLNHCRDQLTERSTDCILSQAALYLYCSLRIPQAFIFGDQKLQPSYQCMCVCVCVCVFRSSALNLDLTKSEHDPVHSLSAVCMCVRVCVGPALYPTGTGSR